MQCLVVRVSQDYFIGELPGFPHWMFQELGDGSDQAFGSRPDDFLQWSGRDLGGSFFRWIQVGC